MKRHINHVTVLGSGVMGSGIACHFANIGVQVLLLDIAPKELTPTEQAKGLTLDSKAVKDRNANEHLQFALKSKPSPIYDVSFASRITVGNFDDDLAKIKDSDWVIEVVVERLDIKQIILEKVDKFRKPGSLITSNTSGIPIHMMAEGRSEDFQKNFCGTHFFNPPRYLRLFEVIPTATTSQDVVDFFLLYGDLFLGKKPVLCKDTPGFIGNRIGVYSMGKTGKLSVELGLTVEETDSLTGAVIGRPKTGTFKLWDLVGIDTAINVSSGLVKNCPNDDMVQSIAESPKYMSFLVENKFLGNKTKKGFYYKEKDPATGKDIRYALDLNTATYRPTIKPTLESLVAAGKAENIKDKLEILLAAKDKGGDLIRKHFASLLAYVSQRVPEISDYIYSMDDAMKTGYAWGFGSFEYWDIIGVQKGIDLIEAEGYKVADWTKEMIAAGNTTFYKVNDAGKKMYYDQTDKTYKQIPGQDATINLDNIRPSKTLWKNAGGAIIDLGDGILNLEFHSKMNSIGPEVIDAINKAIDMAEKEYRGLVIANQGDNFSVGANVAMIMMMVAEQEWDELNFSIAAFQNTMMRIRYSNIPVIAAPHNMALGGGCEVTLHADRVVASSETYMGLVEFGVGLIPAGGGTKELTRRISQTFSNDDVKLNKLRETFVNIATAKVSTSAYEALNMGLLEKGKDTIVVQRERQIAEAKKQAILLAEAGYAKPIGEKIKVLGREAMGQFYVGSDQFVVGQYMSDHDRLIANKLANVIVGGNLSEATLVSEQYLLDLEREAFLSLCGERKTLERIQAIITTGRPLRN